MDTHIHQSLGYPWKQRLLPLMLIFSCVRKNVPSSNHSSTYFIFGNFSLQTFSLSSLVPTPSSNLWWHLWTQSCIPLNTHSATPNKLFLCQIYHSESRKLKRNLHIKPTTCITLLHPLSWKEGTIYSQAFRYNTSFRKNKTFAIKF